MIKFNVAATMIQPDYNLMDLRLGLANETQPDLRADCAVLIARKLRNIGMFEDARKVLEAEQKRAPDHPMLLRSLGLETFRNGEIAKGLKQYDQGRWRLPSFDKYRRPFNTPFWNGQPLKGKKLLVWAEQGIGDQIMQSRVLSKLAEQGANVTLEADIRIQPFLKTRARVRVVQQFVEPALELKQMSFDYQTSMLSAWRFVDDPIGGSNCIEANAGLSQRYKNNWEKMGAKRNVGLSWFSKAKANGAERSLDPMQLRPLSKQPGIRFHSLQYGEYDAVSVTKGLGAPLLVDTTNDPKKDLVKQAAQIAALDLVITIDNATAHIAGALGVPCWVITPKASEWRWGTPEKPNPLYPTVRLFRATDTGNWDAALWQLFDAFEHWANSASGPTIEKAPLTVSQPAA